MYNGYMDLTSWGDGTRKEEMHGVQEVAVQHKVAPSLQDGRNGTKMRDTSKDEAEFILVVSHFKTHDGDHREAAPWDPGGHLTPETGAHFCKCQPHSVPPEDEDPESRSWVRVGWGWEEDRSSPDPVLTMFPTSIGRKNSSAIW